MTEAAEQKEKRGPIMLIVSLSEILGGAAHRMMRERFVERDTSGIQVGNPPEVAALKQALLGAVFYDKAGNTVDPYGIDPATGKLVCRVHEKNGGRTRPGSYLASELTLWEKIEKAHPEARERGRSIDEASPQEWDRAAAAVKDPLYMAGSQEEAEALSNRLRPQQSPPEKPAEKTDTSKVAGPCAVDHRKEQIESMCRVVSPRYGTMATGKQDPRSCLHDAIILSQENCLFEQLAQIYDHHVAPIVKDLEQTKEDLQQTKEDLQRVSEGRGEVQSEYRDLFWTVNAACKRLGIVEPKSNAEAVSAVKFMDELVTEATGVITHIADRLGIGEQTGTMDRHGQYATIIGQVAILKAQDQTDLHKRLRDNEHDYARLMAEHQALTAKTATLRNIVLCLAPHGHDCRPGKGDRCTCWKSQFYAEADK